LPGFISCGLGTTFCAEASVAKVKTSAGTIREMVLFIALDDTLRRRCCCNMSYLDEHDDEDEPREDWEDPDQSDQDDHDDPEQLPCPFCRKPVAEIADICPHCGNFMFSEDAPAERKPVWKWVVVILLVLLLAGVIYFWYPPSS
jgi:hypothetical protein